MLEIDREFQALCPPLQAEEREQLEASLLAEGCREPLCVWEGGSSTVLLDGHNRYTICSTHQVPYETTAIAVGSREEAINWIIANQLGRRNLTPEQKSYLRGKRYNLEKKQHGGDRKSSVDFQHLIGKAEERLSHEYHVVPATIRADGQFATAVDTLEAQVRQDIRDTILRRQDRENGKITKQQAMKAGKLIQERTVEPQPFMQKEGWKPSQVLTAIEMLGTLPSEEHAALNYMLDEPFIPATDALKMLERMTGMSATHRQRIYGLARSSDMRDRSYAKTLVSELPHEPDPQVIVALSLINEIESLRTHQRRSWRRVFPDEPWSIKLDAIDARLAAIQDEWREIAAQVKTSYAERLAHYAETLTD